MGILGYGYKAYKAYKASKKVGKTITSVKPGTNLGSKTVDQIKTRAAAAKASAASFNYKAGVKKAIKKMKDIKSK